MVGFQLRNRQGTRLEVKALLPYREVSGCVPVKAVIANPLGKSSKLQRMEDEMNLLPP